MCVCVCVNNTISSLVPAASLACFSHYTEKGFCMRGDMCPFDHGSDPVVVEDVNLPSILPFPPAPLPVRDGPPPPRLPPPPGLLPPPTVNLRPPVAPGSLPPVTGNILSAVTDKKVVLKYHQLNYSVMFNRLIDLREHFRVRIKLFLYALCRSSSTSLSTGCSSELHDQLRPVHRLNVSSSAPSASASPGHFRHPTPTRTAAAAPLHPG